MPEIAQARIYADRAAGRDRDHRRADRAALARGAGAREAARRAQCTNNLKQMGLAVHNYVQNSLPAGQPPVTQLITPCGSTHEQSFLVSLTPYYEQAQVYNAITCRCTSRT